jgi:hypothetical protein
VNKPERNEACGIVVSHLLYVCSRAKCTEYVAGIHLQCLINGVDTHHGDIRTHIACTNVMYINFTYKQRQKPGIQLVYILGGGNSLKGVHFHFFPSAIGSNDEHDD